MHRGDLFRPSMNFGNSNVDKISNINISKDVHVLLDIPKVEIL